MATSELRPIRCTAGVAAKSIKNYIDDSLTDKEILKRVNYVEICDYQYDGDTVRTQIDIVYKPLTDGQVVTPLLAGVPKVWYDVQAEALNTVFIRRPASTNVPFVLIVGIGR